MSGLVELKKDKKIEKIREWTCNGVLPTCPGCTEDISLYNWEINGVNTCGKGDCITFHLDNIIRKGLKWNGLNAIPYKGKTTMTEVPKSTIMTERTLDGGIVLHKKGGTQEIKKLNVPPTIKTPTKIVTPAKVFKPITDMSKKQVFIHPQAWFDMHFIVKSCPHEVSGLGLVDTVDEGLIIRKVFLIKQKGGAAHTDLNQEAIAELAMSLAAEGEDTGKMRFWWHSHPASGGKPSPSGQDQETFAAWGRGGQHSPKWFINAILSPSGGEYWRLDMYKPIRTAIEINPTFWHPSFGSCDWEAEMNNKIEIGSRANKSSFQSMSYHSHWHDQMGFSD